MPKALKTEFDLTMPHNKIHRVLREPGLAKREPKKAKGEWRVREVPSRVNGIRHIVGRVNHPQTNGKVERFYGTVEQKLKYSSAQKKSL